MGLSAPGRLGRAVSPTSSPPTSSARPSTRPAAGSTASWRSARCCSATTEQDPEGDADHAAGRPIRIRSATASCWADARRRRPEDVQEQAELPRAARDLRPLRGRCPALVLLRQPAAVDLDPLQRAGDQGEHPRVPAAALERLQLLRDLRQHRRLRSGRRLAGRRRATRRPTLLARRRATARSPSAASSTAGSSAS